MYSCYSIQTNNLRGSRCEGPQLLYSLHESVCDVDDAAHPGGVEAAHRQEILPLEVPVVVHV